MSGWQRTIVVKARADLILADKPSVQAYAVHFESQLHRVKARRLLDFRYRWFSRARALLARLRRKGH